MRTTISRSIVAGFLLALGLSFAATSADATDEVAKLEGLTCAACHDKPGSKLLTDKGLYYEEMKTLEGFDQLNQTFQGCTSCHIRKPGAKKLTPLGRRIHRVVGDMDALDEWLRTGHVREHQVEPIKSPERSSESEGNASQDDDDGEGGSTESD